MVTNTEENVIKFTPKGIDKTAKGIDGVNNCFNEFTKLLANSSKATQNVSKVTDKLSKSTAKFTEELKKRNKTIKDQPKISATGHKVSKASDDVAKPLIKDDNFSFVVKKNSDAAKTSANHIKLLTKAAFNLEQEEDKAIASLIRKNKITNKTNMKSKKTRRLIENEMNAIRRLAMVEDQRNKRMADKTSTVASAARMAGTYISSFEKTLKDTGISIERNSGYLQDHNGKLLSNKATLEKVMKTHDSYLGVLGMDKDAFIGLTKAGYKFNTSGGKSAARFREMTHGLHGFKMELLSIMFFGQSMKQLGMGMLQPAMDLYKISELWSTTLQVVMLPVLQALFPYFLSFSLWLMQGEGDGAKFARTILRLVAVVAVVGGTILAVVGSIGLFAGSVVKGFGILLHPIKALKDFRKALKLTSTTTDVVGNAMGKSAEKTNKAVNKSANGMKGSIMGVRITLLVEVFIIIAAIALLYAAWVNNFFGIRQFVGKVLVWFSGTYDKYIKPVLSFFVSGVVFAVNLIQAYWGSLKDGVGFVMLSIISTMMKGKNKLIDIVEGIVNILSEPQRILSGYGSKVTEKLFGITIPKIEKIDLSKYKSSTTEIDEVTEQLGKNIKDNFKKAFTDTQSTMVDFNEKLDSLTPKMKEMGEGFIESGDAIDAEKKRKEEAGESNNYLGNTLDSLKSDISKVTGGLVDSGDAMLENANDTNINTASTSNLTDLINSSTLPTLDAETTALSLASKGFDSATVSADSYGEALQRVRKQAERASSVGVNLPSVSYPEIKLSAREKSEQTSYGDMYKTASSNISTTTSLLSKLIEQSKSTYGNTVSTYGFANGGLVSKPTLALVAEAGPEVITPLNKMGNISGGTTITLNPTYNISGVSSKEDIERMLYEHDSKLIDDLKSMIR